jgi:hypothetical protein
MKTTTLFGFIVFAVLLLPVVASLGISPAGRLFDYQENSHTSMDFVISNNNHKDMSVSISSSGDVPVSCDTTRLVFTSSDEAKFVSCVISMPAGLLPGIRSSTVVAIENSSGQGVSSRAIVNALVRVLVPYPGKFVEAHVLGNNNLITLNLVNRGSVDIVNLSGSVSVGADGVFTTRLIPSRSLVAGEFSRFEFSWESPGIYTVISNYSYDGFSGSSSSEVTLGSAQVLLTPNFVTVPTGQISAINISAFNKWNRALELSTITTINGASLPTSAVTLAPYQHAAVSVLVDATYLAPGSYNAEVVATYPGGVSTAVIPIIVVAPVAVADHVLLWIILVLVALSSAAVVLVLVHRKRGDNHE